MDLTNQVNRVRILTGDTEQDPEYQFFEDSVYQFYLDENNSNETEAAVIILEAMLTNMSLQPSRERSGSFEVYQAKLEFINNRLKELKAKRDKAKGFVPVVINPGSSHGWGMISNLFDSGE